ncbi:hypothetical protein FWK35_00031492 [Aphis craccivora]|uniref:Uncharacterized protein n=1 Tax=Aphis craccivora TaxID=307492 RepID=A0A6G0Y541_APHCR|nr:hypothetical protein FWK35_00031492 [Aphis craccivora]
MNYFLDSERSDKCIDFTMMCVFFLCRSKHFPTVFKKIEKKKRVDTALLYIRFRVNH